MRCRTSPSHCHLPFAICADERGGQYFTALPLKDRWPSDDINGFGLIFQGQKDDAFGRARVLNRNGHRTAACVERKVISGIPR